MTTHQIKYIDLKKLERVQNRFFSFLNPLAVEIWLSIIVAYVLVSLTIWIVARFSPLEWHLTNTPACLSTPTSHDHHHIHHQEDHGKGHGHGHGHSHCHHQQQHNAHINNNNNKGSTCNHSHSHSVYDHDDNPINATHNKYHHEWEKRIQTNSEVKYFIQRDDDTDGNQSGDDNLLKPLLGTAVAAATVAARGGGGAGAGCGGSTARPSNRNGHDCTSPNHHQHHHSQHQHQHSSNTMDIIHGHAKNNERNTNIHCQQQWHNRDAHDHGHQHLHEHGHAHAHGHAHGHNSQHHSQSPRLHRNQCHHDEHQEQQQHFLRSNDLDYEHDCDDACGENELLCIENDFTLKKSFLFAIGTLMQQNTDLNPKVQTRLFGEIHS